MKSWKLGRKLSLQKFDVKEVRDHQPSAHLDELDQASKDMQDMRSCYDGLLSAAAATANSIYEFSESLNEMGNCLLGKTGVDDNAESGKVLKTLGNMQLELQKIADTYRSYVVVTITNPTESLLSELRKVEEMKLQCDEKREVYEYMMSQHKEKAKLRNCKVESSISQNLQEAQEEYDEVTRLCVFRVKSLKEGQWRSLLTQAARHHAAQLNFFRKGVKALEAVDPHIRIVAEKHRIDYQLSDGAAEGVSSTDDGELSFDYRNKKEGLDNILTSSNPMELDRVDITYPRVSSYSAPLFPEKIDPSGKPKETQPGQKYYSYVLPSPVIDTKNPVIKTPINNHFQNLQHQTRDEKHEREIHDESTSTSSAYKSQSDGKSAKRQAYSGPLPPSKTFSGKMSSSWVPVASRSVSPPPLSPKISELHELPRPPMAFKPFASSSSSSLIGHSAPLFFKNKETSPPPPNKRPVLTSTAASPLPPPPLLVSRSFSIPSSNQRAVAAVAALHVPKLKLMESTQPPGQGGSPPLTPASLANMKMLSTVSEVASDMAHI